MSKQTTFPAELVFAERPEGGRWDGQILGGGQVYDTVREESIAATRPWARVVGDDREGYRLTIEGRSRHGRRHDWYPTLTQAQERAVKWCARRFRRLP